MSSVGVNQSLIEQLAQVLVHKNLSVATAESCTGGGIGAAMTALSGSSAWFAGGIISYSNDAKQHLLGVSEASLLEQGAVSEQVVLQMAHGACKQLRADLAVAVSGVAGPTGGSAEKPVGTVWIAWAWQDSKHGATSRCFHFSGDRGAIRQATITAALSGLMRQLTPALARVEQAPEQEK
ncbi:MAG: CinA family protein [Gammaproteobacteria bacterium]|nr:CinA family protein [Gammaproteobacteria bacterium]